MKIGIGVTTYNRPEHLDLFTKQIKLNGAAFVSNSVREWERNCYPVIISNDSKDRKGIAYRKNECLRALKDCDYIFLFDDDCFPIKEGWAEFFIEASKASGQQHFQYLKETPTIKRIGDKGMINPKDGQGTGVTVLNPLMISIYNNSAGCFMFMTKECIEKVGAYNPSYGIYGFEHCGYSNRIHKAGLTPLGAYTCPAGAGEYMYSLDLDFHMPFKKQLNHKSSIEIDKMAEYVEQNKQIYLTDTEIYIPL